MYAPAILFILGCIGVLLHNLIKLNQLNRANDGTVNLGKYFALERFTIIISLIVVGSSAFILNHEISQMDKMVKFLGVGYITLGYFAQSILVVTMGRAQKYIEKAYPKDDTDSSTPGKS
ncbi:MAG TPA: hypothetical protein VFS31_11355 [Chitinophagaceae bacterium]|nr:hypothetical protein [Chitinophagaceae bacterium]